MGSTQSKRQSAIRREHDEWAPVDYVNAAKGDRALIEEMAERWAKEIARRVLAEAASRGSVPCDSAAVDRARRVVRKLLGEFLGDDDEVDAIVRGVFLAAAAREDEINA